MLHILLPLNFFVCASVAFVQDLEEPLIHRRAERPQMAGKAGWDLAASASTVGALPEDDSTPGISDAQ